MEWFIAKLGTVFGVRRWSTGEVVEEVEGCDGGSLTFPVAHEEAVAAEDGRATHAADAYDPHLGQSAAAQGRRCTATPHVTTAPYRSHRLPTSERLLRDTNTRQHAPRHHTVPAHCSSYDTAPILLFTCLSITTSRKNKTTFIFIRIQLAIYQTFFKRYLYIARVLFISKNISQISIKHFHKHEFGRFDRSYKL